MEGGERGAKERGRDGEREIGRVEIRRMVKNLKDGKAGGGEGIPNEV